jgi:hypothetical protein
MSESAPGCVHGVTRTDAPVLIAMRRRVTARDTVSSQRLTGGAGHLQQLDQVGDVGALVRTARDPGDG